MLVEFRVQNHRSLRDEQVLTMEAARIGDPGDARPRRVPGHNRDLLPAAAIYGANASGKSNVLAALGFMRDAVSDSHRSWPPEGGVPRDAFAWGPPSREPSLFEATVLIEGTRFQYGFVVNEVEVLEEWLYAWPRGRRQTWVEREGDGFVFGDKLGGENRTVAQVTRRNALFLSTAAQHEHVQLMPVYRWFSDLKTVRVEGYKERYADAMPASAAAAMFAALAAASAASAGDGNGMIRLFDVIPRPDSTTQWARRLASFDDEMIERLRHLLRAADVGISDFRVERPSPGASKQPRSPKVAMHHDVGVAEAWLALERESAGTRALFQLGPVVLDVLASGTVLLVDELESSLHPLLALEIVKQFNDPQTNPRSAQLVFTTHDTHLIGTTSGDPSLRRDQVWLTERDSAGGTSLFPLTDYKPRKAENLERGYIQGRYGGIPILGTLHRWGG